MAKLLLPLLLLPLVARLPVEALQCYDCLSKAVPACTNGTETQRFDKTPCKPDENYCSMLYATDSDGQKIVSRQCSSSRDEGEQLKKYIAVGHDKDLKMVRFITCQSDLCNIHDPITGNVPVTTSAPAPAAGAAIPSTLPSIVLLNMAVGVAAAVRLRA